MKFKVIFILVLLIVFSFSLASGDVPKMINYQGKITTPQGALIDTIVSINFAIYTDSIGTDSLWSETQDYVKVEKGIFSVLLGSVNPIPDSVFTGEVKYFGVKVGSDPEMSPRKAIVSVAYAMRAGTMEGATGGIIHGNIALVDSLADTTFSIVDGNLHARGDIQSGNSLKLKGAEHKLVSSIGEMYFGRDNGSFGDIKVGIGTTSPTGHLHIKAASGNTKLKLEKASEAGQSQIEFLNSTGTCVWDIYTPGSSNDLRFHECGSGDRVTIQSGGNVGIGTPAPVAHLHIQPSGETNTEVRIVGGLPDNYAWSLLAERTPNILHITPLTAGGILYIGENNGKVGIGTPSPHGKLDLNGSLAVAGNEGSTGQVLTSHGSGVSPVWSDVTAVPNDNSVSQAKLKTAMGEVSTTVPSSLLTLPGGEYGFYPQFKTSGYIGVGAIMLGRFTSDIKSSFEPGHMDLPNYSTKILLSERNDGILYARQRYVTSSGKDHWMFFLIDKDTKQVQAGYQAPDHPCYGSGGDENDIPHPFGSYDPDKHKVILVDNDILPELKSKVTSKRSLLTIINEEYEIDFDSDPVYQPREIIEIDEYGDKKGEILQKIKTPEWAKILIGKDEIYLKRRLVETLPDYISYKKLKSKSEVIAESNILSINTGVELETRSHSK